VPGIRGIVVSVGQWYAETLSVCLWKNMRHLAECLVVTAPGDPSIGVARAVPGVRVFETDAFTRPGADGVRPRFNKGLAIEEGFSYMGRHGWLLVHDADILFPDSLPLSMIRPGYLHGARRRILEDPSAWTPDLSWAGCPLVKDGSAPIGFFQLFDAGDSHLAGKRPWYDVSFGHAGGCDAYFMGHWPQGKRSMLPVEVLHLGPNDTNWMGTSQEDKDLMAKYVYRNKWQRAMQRHAPEAAERAGELPGRIQVPGYPPSDFNLPFERRAAEQDRGR
jgi:hypothetical protein